MTRIIGIDPGSQRTGVGIIDVDAGGKLSHVFHGALAVAGEASFPLRLKRIFDELCAIIAAHRPDECGIERVFMARNADSALKLGQAQGRRDLRGRQSGDRGARVRSDRSKAVRGRQRSR